MTRTPLLGIRQVNLSNVGMLAVLKRLGDKYSGLVSDEIAFGSHFIEMESLMPIRNVYGTIFLNKFGTFR